VIVCSGTWAGERSNKIEDFASKLVTCLKNHIIPCWKSHWGGISHPPPNREAAPRMANLGCPKMGISPQALAVQMENRFYPLDLGGYRIFGQTQIMVGSKSYIYIISIFYIICIYIICYMIYYINYIRDIDIYIILLLVYIWCIYFKLHCISIKSYEIPFVGG